MHREVCDSLSWMSLVIHSVDLYLSVYVARQILDSMLASAKWGHLAPHYDEKKRSLRVDFWHKLDGSVRLIIVYKTSNIANMLA